MALPTISETLGVTAPVLVRKLTRKSHWGLPIEDVANRLPTALQKVFLEDEYYPHVSFYLIQSDDDLRRVAIGLNANRSRLTEILDLVAFLPDEFQAAGLTLVKSEGNTLCTFANQIHHDLEVPDGQPAPVITEKLEALCRLAMQTGRAAGRCKESQMRDVVKLAQAEQCLAALNPSPGCLVPACGG